MADEPTSTESDPPLTRRVLRGLGYRTFVAWRYLMVADTKVTRGAKWRLAGALVMAFVCAIARFVVPGLSLATNATDFSNPAWIAQVATLGLIALAAFLGVLRHSKIALIVCEVGLGIVVVSVAGAKLLSAGLVPLIHPEPEHLGIALVALNISELVGGVLAVLAMFFGCLRAFFTFFTTVPIGGVWIGTAALVSVLAVMSGFETDLREKILGSNAHLQIAREDGEFVEWREVKAKIDKLPGVVASTPFGFSEVVVAANNQGMPVIIKGIDPKTVGKVTDLISDLDDHEAVKRLEPLTTDTRDLTIPQPAQPSHAPVIDPPPPDMPSPGEPIDFSHGEPDTARDTGSADSGPGTADPGAKDPGAVIDPPPKDLITSDEPPADYSQPGYAPDSEVKVIDLPPFDAPMLSKRTQSLPGILVGKELVKQTHMYVGQEVHVVSPLSDPANPDATGTPIPFNRDFRVAGTFFTGMYEYDLKYVYVTLDALQDFLDRGDAVDGIEVRVANPDDTDAYVAQLKQMFGPHYRVQDWKELNRSLFSALKLEKIAMFLVLGIVILVASFAIVGILIMVVVEKQREIALLKTLGATDFGVMQLFAIQGLMIGAIGTVLGVLTGLIICWAAKRFGLPLNPDVYYIDKMPIHVDPMSVLAAASAGVLISIAATVYPAVVAGRVRPAVGMRH